MKNKLAKLRYLPNNFEIIEPGDRVICAISNKKIPLENLNYWNVKDQEAYFSYKEVSKKKENQEFIKVSTCCGLKSTVQVFLKSFFQASN